MKNNYFFFKVRDCLKSSSQIDFQRSSGGNSKSSLILGLLITLFTSVVSMAQVTTNGGSGLSATYPDLASAITALNAATITGPVVITLDPATNQTAPTGGYSITAQGTAVNTIIIDGNLNTVTAPTPQASGQLYDAIFKLVGADYVTIQRFTMVENAANTTTAAGTNNMTEWGVAVLYASTTNGAQNNTIQNNLIDLDRTYQNTFGIYSNSTHAATTPTTSATATSVTGGNHGLKIYANSIQDVNIGVVVIGPTAAADHNDGLDIGGNALASGNAIINYGTTGTFSSYANVSGSVNGILVRNTKNFNVSYNTITSSNGGATAGTLRGIFIPSFSNAPTGTIVNSINSNSISLRSGSATAAMLGISNEATTANATTTLNINNNDFNTFGHTIASSGAITLIINAAASLNNNINGNTFTNLSVNTTGGFIFISNSLTHPANSVNNVNNNAIVTAFNKTGAGGTVYFYDSFGSTTSGTEINTGNNFSNVTLTGATTLGGFRTADGATPFPSKTVTNNIFNNITVGTSTSTVLNVGYSTATVDNFVSGNVVSNVSGVAAITGILSPAGSQNIFGNNVFNLTSTAGATVSAISITGGVTQKLYKNKIYNVEANNAAGVVNGILVSGSTTVDLYNNIIGDLRTPSSNLANPLNGINITGGTNVNAYFNTVMLNASSTGALFGSSAINVATGTTVELRNNIFVNNSSVAGAGLATAYRRSSTTLTSYAAASNNNLFYGSTIFTDGTNTDATIGAFKTRVATRDASSISENPTFTSTDGYNSQFLHINPATPTQIESAGTAVGSVTDDFDSDVRNVSTPDIGADEFTGTPLDLIGPSISHTQVANTCTGGSRVISATMTDASGVPTAGLGLPVAYYNINGGAYSAAVASSLGAGVYEFTIGAGTVQGDIVRYYIVAQDNAGTPNVSALPLTGASGFTSNPPAVATPPTTPFIYSVVTPLNGVYTVGVGGNYTTLTAAVNDYNTKCITGPVTFSLTDATYPSETFPITINTNGDASAVNTLTIKPATGIMPTITGSNATAIIKINGADYVTIDGSNNGSTSNDLTIENTNTATTGVVLWVANASASNAALNTTLKNTKYLGNAPTTTLANIVVSGTVLGAAAEISNSNLLISNNTFLKAQNGVFAIGNATTPDQGWVISNNVGGSSVAADKLGFRGIAVQNADGFVVSGNQILGITTNSTSTTTGILIGAAVTNGSVYNNKISNIKNTNTGGYGSNGILLNAAGTSANISVYNNFIFDIASYGYASGATSTDNGYGLFVNAGGGYSIYNNTIALNTNQNASGLPAAINIGAGVTAAGAINLRNNIFSNSQTQTGERYSIYSAAPNTVFAAIDYNDYATTGTNLGYIGSARVDLAALTTGFGGNTNSKNVTPVFVSATNLHLAPASNDNLNNFGTPIGLVTNDIDGDVRNVTTPDMGADEFTPVIAVVINNVSITPVGNQCTAVSRNVTANITAGDSDIISVVLNYSYNGVAQTPIAMTGGTLTAGSTSTFNATIPVASPANANVTWSVTATDAITNRTTVGTAYQDEPLFGASATASASVPTICNSGGTELIAVLSKSGTRDVGAGAQTTSGSGTSSTNYVSPFTHYYGGYKAQYLIRASELTALGFVAGNNINSMAFDVTTVGASATYTGFTVGVGQTSTSALTTTFDTSSVTQVYTGNLNIPAVGLLNLPFGTGSGSTGSLVWDGISNILVNLCWSNNNGGGAAAGSAEVKYDATSFVAMAYYRVDNQTQAAVCGTATATNTQSNRPKIILGGNLAPAITNYSWSDGSTVVGTGNNLYVSPTVTTTYTGTLTSNGCTIATNSVVVTVNNTAAPTGASPQSFNAGQTLADLVVTGSNIVWYASSSDAASAINPLPASTPLVDNTTYYATQTISSCPSTASLAVLAQVALNTNGFDLSKFKFYPNPVHDILNIDYAQSISKVEVYNAVGQLVSVKYQTGVSTKVNMSTLSDGVYLIKLSSENSTQIIRVVKN